MKDTNYSLPVALVAVVIALIAAYASVSASQSFGGTANSTHTAGYYDAGIGFRINGTTMANSTGWVGPITTGSNTITTGGNLKAGSLTITGTQNSTSTPATSYTLKAADITGYSAVVVTPNIGALTWTLPASSTLTAFLPNAGNETGIWFEDATGTAAATLTLVANTGVSVSVASSSQAFTLQKNRAAFLHCYRLVSTDVMCNLVI